MKEEEQYRLIVLFHCLDAPSWANYAVINNDGYVWVYNHRPTKGLSMYIDKEDWRFTRVNKIPIKQYSQCWETIIELT